MPTSKRIATVLIYILFTLYFCFKTLNAIKKNYTRVAQNKMLKGIMDERTRHQHHEPTHVYILGHLLDLHDGHVYIAACYVARTDVAVTCSLLTVQLPTTKSIEGKNTRGSIERKKITLIKTKI